MLWQSYHRKLLALAENATFLTDSQREAGQSLQQEIADYQQRINLWGGPGVGKTFLAHHLHHRAEGLYFSSAAPLRCPSAEVSPGSVVIIDNAPHDRGSARLIFGEMLWAGASSVILVTRQPIDDAVRRIELGLTAQDLAQIEAVMRQQFGDFPAEALSDYERQRSGIWARVRALSLGMATK